MIQVANNLLEQINQELEALDLDRQPPELYQPMRYILRLGGKRLRPMLALLSYRVYHEVTKEIVKAVNLLEIFHNFTLMHDDIMDQAPIRRGKPAVHKKWNTNTGILCGDIMMVKAYELLENLDHPKLTHCLKAFNDCAAKVCEGQQLDMNFEERTVVREEEYLDMIAKKTAALLGFSTELGAILAEAPEKERIHLKNFGLNIGMGFQLMDDLLDVYGDREKFGKQPGGDILANKKTYLLIKALEKAGTEEKQVLGHWMSLEEFNSDEKIEAVRGVFDRLSLRAIAEDKIKSYFSLAYKALDGITSDAAGLLDLREFADYLIERDR